MHICGVFYAAAVISMHIYDTFYVAAHVCMHILGIFYVPAVICTHFYGILYAPACMLYAYLRYIIRGVLVFSCIFTIRLRWKNAKCILYVYLGYIMRRAFLSISMIHCMKMRPPLCGGRRLYAFL